MVFGVVDRCKMISHFFKKSRRIFGQNKTKRLRTKIKQIGFLDRSPKGGLWGRFTPPPGVGVSVKTPPALSLGVGVSVKTPTPGGDG